jgi:hypothetical protein
MRDESTSVRVARMPGNSVRKKRRPWRTAIPRSTGKARIWLMMLVLWLTSRSRTRCSACKSSWSAVLVATNFEFHRRALHRLGDCFRVAKVVLPSF